MTNQSRMLCFAVGCHSNDGAISDFNKESGEKVLREVLCRISVRSRVQLVLNFADDHLLMH